MQADAALVTAYLGQATKKQRKQPQGVVAWTYLADPQL